MKRTNKLILVLCIIFTILALGITSFASDTEKSTQLKPSDLFSTGPVEGQEEITQLGQSIVGVVQTVGVVVAVVILLVLGVKYMMGSAEEKADYKKSMIPYIVGAVCIFAATTIVNIVYNLAIGLNNQSDGTK